MNKGILKKIKILAILLISGLFGFLLGYADLFGDFKPIQYEIDSLNNGLKIIYNVDKSAPVIATVLHYKVGSRNETVGKTGYAHFFEHLMFEGTKDIPRGMIDKYVQEAGGDINAGTSFDQTVYHFKLQIGRAHV